MTFSLFSGPNVGWTWLAVGVAICAWTIVGICFVRCPRRMPMVDEEIWNLYKNDVKKWVKEREAATKSFARKSSRSKTNHHVTQAFKASDFVDVEGGWFGIDETVDDLQDCIVHQQTMTLEAMINQTREKVRNTKGAFNKTGGSWRVRAMHNHSNQLAKRRAWDKERERQEKAGRPLSFAERNGLTPSKGQGSPSRTHPHRHPRMGVFPEEDSLTNLGSGFLTNFNSESNLGSTIELTTLNDARSHSTTRLDDINEEKKPTQTESLSNLAMQSSFLAPRKTGPPKKEDKTDSFLGMAMNSSFFASLKPKPSNSPKKDQTQPAKSTLTMAMETSFLGPRNNSSPKRTPPSKPPVNMAIESSFFARRKPSRSDPKSSPKPETNLSVAMESSFLGPRPSKNINPPTQAEHPKNLAMESSFFAPRNPRSDPNPDPHHDPGPTEATVEPTAVKPIEKIATSSPNPPPMNPPEPDPPDPNDQDSKHSRRKSWNFANLFQRRSGRRASWNVSSLFRRRPDGPPRLGTPKKPGARTPGPPRFARATTPEPVAREWTPPLATTTLLNQDHNKLHATIEPPTPSTDQTPHDEDSSRKRGVSSCSNPGPQHPPRRVEGHVVMPRGKRVSGDQNPPDSTPNNLPPPPQTQPPDGLLTPLSHCSTKPSTPHGAQSHARSKSYRFSGGGPGPPFSPFTPTPGRPSSRTLSDPSNGPPGLTPPRGLDVAMTGTTTPHNTQQTPPPAKKARLLTPERPTSKPNNKDAYAFSSPIRVTERASPRFTFPPKGAPSPKASTSLSASLSDPDLEFTRETS